MQASGGPSGSFHSFFDSNKTANSAFRTSTKNVSATKKNKMSKHFENSVARQSEVFVVAPSVVGNQHCRQFSPFRTFRKNIFYETLFSVPEFCFPFSNLSLAEPGMMILVDDDNNE